MTKTQGPEWKGSKTLFLVSFVFRRMDTLSGEATQIILPPFRKGIYSIR